MRIIARAVPTIDPTAVRLKPAQWLDSRFADYQRAIKGARYDADTKTYLVPRHAWHSIALRLEDTGFEIDACPVATQWRVMDTEMTATLCEQADERVASIASKLALDGKPLRPYQIAGIRWLARQRAALLTDEQGLGKTVQALCAIPTGAPVIVECPASLRLYWRDEIVRWRHDLAPIVQPDPRYPKLGEALIVSDGWIRKLVQVSDLVIPDNVFLISDEAHRYKGRSARAEAMAMLCADIRRRNGSTIGLTGTPMMNSPLELYAVLSVFGAARKAFGAWGAYCKGWHATKGRFHETIWGEPSQAIRDGLASVTLRRTRAEVLPELPTWTYQRISVDVGPQFAKRLDVVYADLETKIRDWEHDANSAFSIGAHSRTMVDLARKKIDAMLQWVTLREDDGPLVVFSSHRAPLDALGTLPGWGLIHGDTPMAQRHELVERFQGGKLRGLGCSIRAAGVGLTLTKAHHMIFVDRSYVPAENMQARDRLVRFGQHHPVLVAILVADHPFERRLDEILDNKIALIEQVV